MQMHSWAAVPDTISAIDTAANITLVAAGHFIEVDSASYLEIASTHL